MCGVGPWRENDYVAAWNQDNGTASITTPAPRFLEELYIKEGLFGMDAVARTAERTTDELFIIIDKSELPATRNYRNDWHVDHEKKRVITRI